MRRRVALAAVALLLSLAGGLLTSAIAQDASRPVGDAAAASRPSVGSDVRYVDAEGAERGLVTVEEIQDPFEGFPADSPPAADARYAVVVVAFEATGGKPFDADPADLLLQDADGYLWGTVRVPRGEEVAVPDLESQELAPGNRISGAVGFLIPAEASVANVYYQPERGQLVLLADLQPDAQRPALGSPVPYFDAAGEEQGTVTVREVQDPFEDFPADSAPERGARYVLLTVVFEATGASSFAADPYDLIVQDADGFLWGQTSVPREGETTVPDLESHQLSAGNRISGAVGFVVPANAQLTHIFYQPERGRLILLADLLLEPA